MLKVKIVCVGKIKEDFFEKALAEYGKRLSRFCDFKIEEIAESRLNDETAADVACALEEEGKSILKKADGLTVLLDRQGVEASSFDMAKLLKSSADVKGGITFIVGSSHGVSQSVFQRADKVISFGKITFPHQLFRVVLAEQIYRGFTIINGSAYHK